MFEASAPCVIWIDEIEKEFAGMQGKGESDSGVNKRCLAKLLNWMQENKESCFICATANHTKDLPPELLRRGRFDRLYYTFLPMQEQCVEIMHNHLCNIKNQFPHLFALSVTEESLFSLCAEVFEEIAKEYKNKFFTGSDIEGLVRDAKFELFLDVSRIGNYSIDDFRKVLLDTIEKTITYSETNFDNILDYWIELRAQRFHNTAVLEEAKSEEDKYQYILFDFSDLQYDGSNWNWKKGLTCNSSYEYDKNMFKVLTEGIKRRISTKINTTHID